MFKSKTVCCRQVCRRRPTWLGPSAPIRPLQRKSSVCCRLCLPPQRKTGHLLLVVPWTVNRSVTEGKISEFAQKVNNGFPSFSIALDYLHSSGPCFGEFPISGFSAIHMVRMACAVDRPFNFGLALHLSRYLFSIEVKIKWCQFGTLKVWTLWFCFKGHLAIFKDYTHKLLIQN